MIFLDIFLPHHDPLKSRDPQCFFVCVQMPPKKAKPASKAPAKIVIQPVVEPEEEDEEEDEEEEGSGPEVEVPDDLPAEVPESVSQVIELRNEVHLSRSPSCP